MWLSVFKGGCDRVYYIRRNDTILQAVLKTRQGMLGCVV